MELKERDQNRDTKDLRPFAASLVHPSLTEHKDKTVRLLTACCLAEILRVFAPNAPYDDSELSTVFSLFVSQLEALGKTRDANFEFAADLLHNIAMVRSFSVCADLEGANDIVVSLFNMCFQIIS